MRRPEGLAALMNPACPSLLGEQRNGCYAATFPVESQSEASRVRQLGEINYDREQGARAVAWIRSHPRRFAELTAARVVDFWFPEPGAPVHTYYAIWLITLLSVPGIVLMARDRMPVVCFMGALWAVYPLMYYFVVSLSRYRYPVLWSSLVPAGYFLWVVWVWVSRFGSARPA